jgi:ribosomal protein L32
MASSASRLDALAGVAAERPAVKAPCVTTLSFGGPVKALAAEKILSEYDDVGGFKFELFGAEAHMTLSQHRRAVMARALVREREEWEPWCESITAAYGAKDFVAEGMALVGAIREACTVRVGAAVLFKGGQPGEGVTMAVVRRKDGYFENAVGGKMVGADSGGDMVERAHACTLRELREEVGGLWGFEMVPRLPFLGRVQTWYDGVLCDMHVFLMPVVAPAHRLRLVDRQGGLTFVSIPTARRMLISAGDKTLPSFGPVLDLFEERTAEGVWSLSGVCATCGRFGLAHGVCWSCGGRVDATDNSMHFYGGAFVEGFRP